MSDPTTHDVQDASRVTLDRRHKTIIYDLRVYWTEGGRRLSAQEVALFTDQIKQRYLMAQQGEDPKHSHDHLVSADVGVDDSRDVMHVSIEARWHEDPETRRVQADVLRKAIRRLLADYDVRSPWQA
jgi:hypothetical protein